MLTKEREALNATDRCDYCSAAAKVVATFIHGELMFCGHHARDFKPGFESKALGVYDPEGELTLV